MANNRARPSSRGPDPVLESMSRPNLIPNLVQGPGIDVGSRLPPKKRLHQKGTSLAPPSDRSEHNKITCMPLRPSNHSASLNPQSLLRLTRSRSSDDPTQPKGQKRKRSSLAHSYNNAQRRNTKAGTVHLDNHMLATLYHHLEDKENENENGSDTNTGTGGTGTVYKRVTPSNLHGPQALTHADCTELEDLRRRKSAFTTMKMAYDVVVAKNYQLEKEVMQREEETADALKTVGRLECKTEQLREDLEQKNDSLQEIRRKQKEALGKQKLLKQKVDRLEKGKAKSDETVRFLEGDLIAKQGVWEYLERKAHETIGELNQNIERLEKAKAEADKAIAFLEHLANQHSDDLEFLQGRRREQIDTIQDLEARLEEALEAKSTFEERVDSMEKAQECLKKEHEDGICRAWANVAALELEIGTHKAKAEGLKRCLEECKHTVRSTVVDASHRRPSSDGPMLATLGELAASLGKSHDGVQALAEKLAQEQARRKTVEQENTRLKEGLPDVQADLRSALTKLQTRVSTSQHRDSDPPPPPPPPHVGHRIGWVPWLRSFFPTAQVPPPGPAQEGP